MTSHQANWLYDGLTEGFPGDRATPCVHLPSGETVSYGALEAAAGRYSASFIASGVRPGDRVAVQVDKSLGALLAYLGAVRAGAVLLPMNTGYARGEVAYLLGDAEPALFVCDPSRVDDLAGVAKDVGAHVLTMDSAGEGDLAADAASRSDDAAPVPRAADDLAAILYTSGTTGRPKGAMLTHDNLYSNTRTLVEAWHFTADDVLIHALPVFHTHGLFVATHCVLLTGSAMHFLPKFDAQTVMDLMPISTTMMGVPTFYTRLLAEDGLAEAAKGMRLFVSGSAPLLAETHQAFEARTGHAILERYGMTETTMITSNPYEGPRRPGTVGRPLEGVEVRITDPDAKAGSIKLCAANTVGMVEVRGPNVFKGYWRMPEKTAEEKRPDGYFITGDLGMMDDDGVLHIVGRGKDLIISGGFNIYPKEVETVIDALEGVEESAVIGVPHPDFGEGVVAVVVPQPGATVTGAAVMDGIKGELARFKQPKHIAIVAELPRNTMGKVQKTVLRDTYSDVLAG
ncbi:MAG: malonyl-CoA synthase [Pseudomonadota bacterium]